VGVGLVRLTIYIEYKELHQGLAIFSYQSHSVCLSPPPVPFDPYHDLINEVAFYCSDFVFWLLEKVLGGRGQVCCTIKHFSYTSAQISSQTLHCQKV